MPKRIVPLLLALALLASCGRTPPEPTASSAPAAGTEFEALRGALNLARQSAAPWTEAEKALGLPPEGAGEPLTDDEISALVTPGEALPALLPEETAAEVELLFRALKSAYGAYYYLGGDEAFLPVQEAILAETALRPQTTPAQLEAALVQHLAPLLRDGSVQIGGRTLMEDTPAMYYVPDLYFAPDQGAPSDIVKPTVGPDGAVTCAFIAMSTDGADLPATGTVEGEEVSLRWQRAEEFVPESAPAYERTAVGGLPVLVCRTLSDEADPQGVKALAGAGADWRDTPLFLADLRSNGGGSTAYALEWFRAYADSDPPVKSICLQNGSALFFAASQAADLYGDSQGFVDPVSSQAGVWTTAVTQGGQVPSGGTILLLQDGGTAAGGERFVKYLSTLENTVRVGAPTKGCCMMGSAIEIALPKSGVSLRFGTGLEFYETAENSEGVGIAPDLWVPPDQAADAVTRLCRYYTLT